jgi:hypothetical protein
LHLLLGSGAATTVKDVQSRLKPPKQHYVTWHKPSCWLDMRTLDAPTDAKIYTYPFLNSSAATNSRTPLPNPSLRYPSVQSKSLLTST